MVREWIQSLRQQALLAVLLSALMWLPVSAQEQFHLTQFIYSAHAINPAFSGVEDQVNVHAGLRRQWTSANNAPLTHYAGIKGSLDGFKRTLSDKRSLRMSVPRLYNRMQFEPGNVAHGLGAYFSTDRQGPFNRTSIYFSYAYIYTMSRSFKISMGLSGHLGVQRFNQDRVSVYNPTMDQVYQGYINGGGSKTDLGLNLGVLLYGKNLFLGYATHGLAETTLNNINVEDIDLGLYHFVIAGYNFRINNQLTLQPSAMAKYNQYYKLTVDYLAKLKFRELIWLGLGYRDEDAVLALFGFMIEEKLHLSYSYDAPLNTIGSEARGSHELVLAFRIYNDRVSKPFLW